MLKRKVFLMSLIFICATSIAAPLPLPKNLIPLNSPEGTQIFKRNQNLDYFWRLNSNFVSQNNLAFCSIASSVMVLNALNVMAPRDPNYGSYRIFTQNNFFTPKVEALLPSALVRKQGASLEQISRAIATFGVKVTTIHANQSSLDNFRRLAKSTIENNHGYIIVNFLRPALGEEGGGHMSPLAAYDKKTDRFLMLDVARYRYGVSWIKTQDLWKAMNTFDKEANAYRGFILAQHFRFKGAKREAPR